MQTIKTVGDLKRVLSVYDDTLPLTLFSDGHRLSLGTDLQVFVASCGKPGDQQVMIELHPVTLAVLRRPLRATWLLRSNELRISPPRGTEWERS